MGGMCTRISPRVTNRDEKINDNEDQYLVSHANNGRNKRKD